MANQQQPDPPRLGPSAPAGWYPHPSMAGTQAYWDGREWTEHVAPAVSETPQRAEVTALQSTVLKLVLVAAAVAVVAFVLMFVVNVANG